MSSPHHAYALGLLLCLPGCVGQGDPAGQDGVGQEEQALTAANCVYSLSTSFLSNKVTYTNDPTLLVSSCTTATETCGLTIVGRSYGSYMGCQAVDNTYPDNCGSSSTTLAQCQAWITSVISGQVNYTMNTNTFDNGLAATIATEYYGAYLIPTNTVVTTPVTGTLNFEGNVYNIGGTETAAVKGQFGGLQWFAYASSSLSYSFVGGAGSCAFAGGQVPNGSSVPAYQTASAPCSSQVRVCSNSVLSGSYAYASCAHGGGGGGGGGK